MQSHSLTRSSTPRAMMQAVCALVIGACLLPTVQAACMGMELHAHRGAPGFPENSKSSVQAALSGSWDGVEIDVQGLSDGNLAVHHDMTTTRTTNLQRRSVRQLNSATWSEVRLKNKSGQLTRENAPFLRDFLPSVQDSGKVINVEVKEEYRSCQTAQTAANELAILLPSQRWAMSAVDISHLNCVRQLNSQAYLGLVVLDKASMALSDKRTARYAGRIASPNFTPQYLSQVVRQIGAPAGLHVDVFSFRANPNLLADAERIGLPIFTYSLRGDDEHIRELKRVYQQRNMLPSGAIIDGQPHTFCNRLAT